MLSVPGYDNKVEFGTMVSFAYPVEGHGESLRLRSIIVHIIFYCSECGETVLVFRWRGGSVHHPS